MTHLPRVGDRFRLTRDVDRYPHFIAAEGTPGTVTGVTDGVVSLRLDIPLPGAEQWDNEVVWDTDAVDFWADVEAEREGEPALLEARVDQASLVEHGDARPPQAFEAGAQDRLERERATRAETAGPADEVTYGARPTGAEFTRESAIERPSDPPDLGM